MQRNVQGLELAKLPFVQRRARDWHQEQLLTERTGATPRGTGATTTRSRPAALKLETRKEKPWWEPTKFYARGLVRFGEGDGASASSAVFLAQKSNFHKLYVP